MSYLQVDLSAFDQLADLAFRANLPDEDRALGGLTRLWLHCWRNKRATATREDVCVAFRVRPEEPAASFALIHALVAYGFLTGVGDQGGWVVRGAEKRLGLLKARQKAAAKARGQEAPQAPEAPQEPARALPGPSAQPMPAPKAPEPKGMTPAKDIVGRLFGALSQGAANKDGQNGQHQPAQRHEPPTPAAAQQPGPDTAPVAPPAGKAAASSPGKAQEPKPPNEHQALIDRLCASYQRHRGSKYGFTPRDAKAVEALRKLGAADEVVRRWESALQTEGYLGCGAIYELPAKWNHHTNRSNAATTSQQLAPSDDEWDRQMMAAAKRLGAPQGWHRDQQWLKKVQTAAYETWAHKELERHQAGVPHDA